jgi:hypothetical protein
MFRHHPIIFRIFSDFFPFFLEKNPIFRRSKIPFHGLQILYLDSSSLNLFLEVFLEFLEF